jgi:hypothetical protein
MYMYMYMYMYTYIHIYIYIYLYIYTHTHVDILQLGSKIHKPGIKIHNTGIEIQGPSRWISIHVLWILIPGLWILIPGFADLDFRAACVGGVSGDSKWGGGRWGEEWKCGRGGTIRRAWREWKSWCLGGRWVGDGVVGRAPTATVASFMAAAGHRDLQTGTADPRSRNQDPHPGNRDPAACPLDLDSRFVDLDSRFLDLDSRFCGSRFPACGCGVWACRCGFCLHRRHASRCGDVRGLAGVGVIPDQTSEHDLAVGHRVGVGLDND